MDLSNVNDFAEHGDPTPENMTLINRLLSNPDEEELWQLKWIIGWMRLMKSESLPEKSRKLCDQYTEIADSAQTLAALVEQDLRHFLSDVRNLLLLAEKYRERASDADPKGKRQKANATHYKLAYLLAKGINDGKLSLKLHVDNHSDLAKLFRICCSEINISSRDNVSLYLTAAREQVKKDHREIEIRLGMQQCVDKIIQSGLDQSEDCDASMGGLLLKVARGGVDANGLDQSKDWKALRKLQKELKDLQKD